MNKYPATDEMQVRYERAKELYQEGYSLMVKQLPPKEKSAGSSPARGSALWCNG